jgi:hypothetical protein
VTKLLLSACLAAASVSVWYQFGRSSPLFDDFFCGGWAETAADSNISSKHKTAPKHNQKQKKGKQKGKEDSSDMLLLHAGPLKATPMATPLKALLEDRTVLNEQEVRGAGGPAIQGEGLGMLGWPLGWGCQGGWEEGCLAGQPRVGRGGSFLGGLGPRRKREATAGDGVGEGCSDR